jgi:hypothetical protein
MNDLESGCIGSAYVQEACSENYWTLREKLKLRGGAGE